MKVLRCHDCGEMPEEMDVGGEDHCRCYCAARHKGDHQQFAIVWMPVNIWNAMQRRKRMAWRMQLLCGAQSWPTEMMAGMASQGGEYEWAEQILDEKFGPADGEEVDHD